jgi:hypothetical protein
MPRVFTGPEFLDLITPLVPKLAFIEKCYSIGGPSEGILFMNLMEDGGSSRGGCPSDDPAHHLHCCMVDPEGNALP